MSVITNRHADFPADATPYSIPAPLRRTAMILLSIAAILCVVAIIASAGLLAYGRLQHGSTIYSGVTAAGVDLGGKSQSDAQAALQQRFDAYMEQPIQFTAGDRTFEATPADLGVTFDTQATVDKAYDFGRSENLWRESRNWLDALVGGHDVTPIMHIDADRFAAFATEQADGLAVAPQDAKFVQQDDGSISVDAGHEGVAVNIEATYDNFIRDTRGLESDPVKVVTVPVKQDIHDQQLQGALEQAQAIASHPFQMTLNGTVWQIPSGELFTMLRVDTSGDSVNVNVDESAIRSVLASLESSVFTPGTDASIRNDNGTFTVTPSQDGHKLDIGASTDAAVAALNAGETSVDLATTPVAPNVTDDEANQAKADAEKLVAQPVTMTWDSGTTTIQPNQLAAAVRFNVDAGRNPNVTVDIDHDLMSKILGPVAEQVKVDGRNADLRWIDGKIEVRSPEQAGRGLDVEATVDALIDAVNEGTTNVAVVTMDVKPQVTADMAAGIQIKDKLAESGTEYGSSSPSRLHNVELAASRLNGAMVPPGGTFSFNDAIGPVTYDSGYQTGYGIVITNGSISTIPSVGGGICQVATTMFQSAFWAGMPITQRSWHLYWIPRYGQPPSGMKGLDATVDPDYDLDFQFKNGSDNWIAVKAGYDGSMLHFELWGSNTGWQVTADPPVITNVVPASQEMFYEHSSELPAGTSVFVEEAQDGFDAAIHRVVKKGDQVIEDTVFTSTYAPAKNTTLIGTGG